MFNQSPLIPILWGLLLLLGWSCQNQPAPQVEAEVPAYAGPPYTIQLQEFVNPALPGLHSYIHATYQDKIVMIGGRTNGLHPDYSFTLEYANQTIYVVDTKNWGDPTTWQVSSMPYDNIKGVDNSQFRANNAQFFQRNDVLYIVGGLEYANVPTELVTTNGLTQLRLAQTTRTLDGQPPQGPETMPYLTAIDLPALVTAVQNKQTVLPPAVRQVRNDTLAITGGELELMGDSIYLVFGWEFAIQGNTTTEAYSHQVRSFTVADDGKNLTLSPIRICGSCWDGVDGANNDPKTGNFRRRDGSMSLFPNPADGSNALMYYAGVFKNGQTNFDTPVFIQPGQAAEQSFTMRWNVYTCQVVPVRSASRQQTYASMLGGMTYNLFTGDPISQPTLLDATNTTPVSLGGFSNIPMSNRLTTIMMAADGSLSQYILPDSFPLTAAPLLLPAIGDTIAAETLPAGSLTFNGSESEMHWTLGEDLAPGGVVDLDKFLQANPQGGTVAYLHGGIESVYNNLFGQGGRTLHYSVASKRLFAVRIVPAQ